MSRDDRGAGLVAVVNPAAKAGRIGERLPAIRQAVLGEFAARVVQTLRRGHAEEWARTFRHEPGFLVIGGDGTLHEVLSGMDTGAQSVALVPSGTGNSLGRDLGMPDLAAVLDAVAAARTEKMDLIRVTFRRADGTKRTCVAASTLALGYPARVVQFAESWFKGLGPLCYPLASAAASFGVPEFTAVARLDGARGRRVRLTGLLVNNTRHAANFVAFPGAKLADGRFDVMELRAGFIGQMLHNLSVLTRTYWWRAAGQGQARRLSLVLARPAMLMVDGELYAGVTSLDLAVLPGRLSVFVPAGRKLA